MGTLVYTFIPWSLIYVSHFSIVHKFHVYQWTMIHKLIQHQFLHLFIFILLILASINLQPDDIIPVDHVFKPNLMNYRCDSCNVSSVWSKLVFVSTLP